MSSVPRTQTRKKEYNDGSQPWEKMGGGDRWAQGLAGQHYLLSGLQAGKWSRKH